MPHLSPQTLTQAEQKTILRATRRNLRDHLIYSLALGTGLRLAEIVGLDVGDVYTPDGKPKNRIRLRPEIAENGRAGDVFLPDALLAKFRRFWRHEARGATAQRSSLLQPEPPAHLIAAFRSRSALGSGGPERICGDRLTSPVQARSLVLGAPLKRSTAERPLSPSREAQPP